MLFPPTKPLWVNNGNISWFQKALLLSWPYTVSQNDRGPSHPLGGGEEEMDHWYWNLPNLSSLFSLLGQNHWLLFQEEKMWEFRWHCTVRGTYPWGTCAECHTPKRLTTKWDTPFIWSRGDMETKATEGSPRSGFEEHTWSPCSITFQLSSMTLLKSPLLVFGKRGDNSHLPHWAVMGIKELSTCQSIYKLQSAMWMLLFKNRCCSHE